MIALCEVRLLLLVKIIKRFFIEISWNKTKTKQKFEMLSTKLK